MALEVQTITQIKYSNTAGTAEVRFAADVCLVRNTGNAHYYKTGTSLLTSGDNGKLIESILDEAREPYCTFNV